MRSTDDLDRPVRIPLSHAVWLARSAKRSEPARAARAGGGVRTRLRSTAGVAIRTVTSMRVLSVLLPALGGAAILGVIVVLMTQDRAMAIGLLVFSPVYVPLMTLLMISGRGLFGMGRTLAGDVSRAMLGLLRCPSCGYDLSRSPVEEDGCRHCPECGSAWSDERCGERGRAPARVVVIHPFGTPDGSEPTREP